MSVYTQLILKSQCQLCPSLIFCSSLGQLSPALYIPALPSPATQSSHQYADPVTDLLDQGGVFRTRLFRESCVFHQGCYVKDLSRLGRDLHKTLILDNSPASYIFHPNNAVSLDQSLQIWCTLPFIKDLVGCMRQIKLTEGLRT